MARHERGGRGVERSADMGPYDDTAARKHPDVRIAGRVIRGVAYLESSVLGGEQIELRSNASSRKIAGVTIQCAGEDEVKAENECGNCHRHRRDDEQEQPAPDAERLHP